MPTVDLTDPQIAALIAEPKVLPRGYERRFKLKPRRSHSEAHLDIEATSGARYRFILRQSKVNSLDFSAILGYYIPGTNRLFLLKRYNGKSHEHTNTIERQTFYDFHIHTATERYQMKGADEEHYAEPTDRYATLMAAFECLMEDCAVELEIAPSGQQNLW